MDLSPLDRTCPLTRVKRTRSGASADCPLSVTVTTGSLMLPITRRMVTICCPEEATTAGGGGGGVGLGNSGAGRGGKE